MWCANCQADVAAEVTADTRRIRCATCGATIDSAHGLRATARTREARELLERWSSGALLDPFENLAEPIAPVEPPARQVEPWAASAESAAVPSSEPAAAPLAPAASTPARRTFRVDKSHQQPGDASSRGETVVLPESAARRQPEPVAARETAHTSPRRAAESHDEPRAPHDRDEDRDEEPLREAVPARASRASMRPAPRDASTHDDESSVPVPRHRRPRRERSRPSRDEGMQRDAERNEATDEAVEVGPTDRPARRRMRGHAPHEPRPPAPHFDVQELMQEREPRKPNATSVTGQMLAYSGVLGLTIGTAMVVWGYFGGPDNFAPTGWLITTAGQMLLFLGVVTLVSGGMEQTTDEVARRIDRLGEKLIRIEQASRDHALRGPSIPAERFAPDAASETAQRSATRTPA